MHWLTEPGIPAGQRNAPITQARIGVNVWDRYEEGWDRLDQSAYDAPVLLPDWIMDKIDEPRIASLRPIAGANMECHFVSDAS